MQGRGAGGVQKVYKAEADLFLKFVGENISCVCVCVWHVGESGVGGTYG